VERSPPFIRAVMDPIGLVLDRLPDSGGVATEKIEFEIPGFGQKRGFPIQPQADKEKKKSPPTPSPESHTI